MTITYENLNPVTVSTRAFESALAAFRCNDANPMRQYLGLPLKVDCDDCGNETVPNSWGKELLCHECTQGRHEELHARYDSERDAMEYSYLEFLGDETYYPRER